MNELESMLSEDVIPEQCQSCINRWKLKQCLLTFLWDVTALVMAAAICFFIRQP